MARGQIVSSQNLFLQSETFDSASWVIGASHIVVTPDQAANPLTGTTTADAIAPDNVNATHALGQVIASGTALVSGDIFCLSIFAKWISNEEWLYIGPNGLGEAAWFNVRTGAAGSVSGSNFLATSIQAVTSSYGAGWYYIQAVMRCVNASSGQFFGIANGNGGVAFVGSTSQAQLWWGASCTKANATRPYVATAGALVNTGPVRNTTPLACNRASSTRSLAGWSKGVGTDSIAVDAITAPVALGGLSDGLIADGTNTTHVLFQGYTCPNQSVTGQRISFGGYFKKGTQRYIALSFRGGATTGWFDLLNGVVASQALTTGYMTDAGSGWYRCWITGLILPGHEAFTTCDIYSAPADGSTSFAGDGVSVTTYADGIQLTYGTNHLGDYVDGIYDVGPIRSLRSLL